jgi:hypothetical protein
MGQINTTNLPDYVPEARPVNAAQRSTGETINTSAALETFAAQDEFQFTKLSGVLNSFKKGAAAMRNQASQLMGAVRGGTYEVDSLLVSRSIVGDCLSPR